MIRWKQWRWAVIKESTTPNDNVLLRFFGSWANTPMATLNQFKIVSSDSWRNILGKFHQKDIQYSILLTCTHSLSFSQFALYFVFSLCFSLRHAQRNSKQTDGFFLFKQKLLFLIHCTCKWSLTVCKQIISSPCNYHYNSSNSMQRKTIECWQPRSLSIFDFGNVAVYRLNQSVILCTALLYDSSLHYSTINWHVCTVFIHLNR